MKLQPQIYIGENEYKSAYVCVIALNYNKSELCFLMYLSEFYLVNDLLIKKQVGSDLFRNLVNNSNKKKCQIVNFASASKKILLSWRLGLGEG